MFSRLKAMQAQGRLDVAEASFSRIISTDPNQLYGWLGFGYCASLKGDPNGAALAFEKALSICPDDDDAAIECAAALAVAGKKHSARAVLAARPESLSQQLALGDWEERHGSADAALLHFEAAHGLDPQAEAPLQRMINLHRSRQQFAAAHAVTDRLAAATSLPRALAWRQRAKTYSAAGDRTAAVDAWRIAASLAPDLDHITIDLARELQRLGRSSEAYELLAARPASCGILVALGDLELARRNHDAAISCAQAAHEMQPLKAEPLAQIARIEADRGRYERAYAAAARIEDIGQEHRLASLRSQLATAKIAGDEPNALRILCQIAAAQPHDAGVMVELARQYRVIGDGAMARQTANEALELAEHYFAALTELGEQAVIADDRDTALAFYSQVLELAPEHVGHHLRVARLLYDSAGRDEAEAALAVAEARFGQTPELYGLRISILRDSGQLAEALDEARKAQAAHPGDHGRWFDRFHLELRLSSVSEVRHCLDRAPATTSDHEAQVLLARALLARRENDDQLAIAHCEAALRVRPNNVSILNQLVELYLINGQVEKATLCHTEIEKRDAAGRRLRRMTTNASQSHQGQLLNEFSLDREANAEVSLAKKLAIADQVPALLTLVKTRPAHIPTAIALLVALRCGDLLKRQSKTNLEASTQSGIPRTVGQYWDDPDLPQDLLALSRSWQVLNPDHRHVLFNDATAQTYLGAHFHRAVCMAYLRCGDATTKADLFRLAFLVREGGVWADMDDRCTAPLSEIIPPLAEALFWQESAGTLCNNFIAATPAHPILLRALGSAVQAINRGDRDKVWMLTGPGLITRAFACEMAKSGDDWPAWLDRVAVLDEFELHPLVAVHCRTSHKRLGKHWTTTGFSAGRIDSQLKAQRSASGPAPGSPSMS